MKPSGNGIMTNPLAGIVLSEILPTQQEVAEKLLEKLLTIINENV